MAEPVAQCSGGQQQGGKRQGVGVHHPLQPQHPDLPSGADRGEGDIDDRDIELDQEEGQARSENGETDLFVFHARDDGHRVVEMSRRISSSRTELPRDLGS